MGDETGVASEVRARRSALARIAWWVALLAIIGIAIPFAARATGIEDRALATLVAFVPWFTLALLVPLVLALVVRAWVLAGVAAALLALGIVWMAPLYAAADAGGETALKVGAVNVTYGLADPDQVVALARDNNLDLLAITELTPDAERALHAAGLDELMPHSEVHAQEGFTGTGLWSRHPLESATALDGFVSQTIEARVEIGGTTATVFAVHPASPGPVYHAAWAADLLRLHSVLAAAHGPTVVIGDFNTTRDHRAFREFEALGYVDAADEAGVGFQPTFPQGRGTPPLVAIDHVLTRDTPWVATGLERQVITRADHLAIVVTYAER